MKVSEVSRTEFLQAFEKHLAGVLKDRDGVIGEAMRYAALDGGKRIRPLCVYYGAKAMEGKCAVEDLMSVATAIELIHSYSLVHDDMPEMDNDTVRRGKPSVFAKFGVPTALLVGDGLLSLAMKELLSVEKSVAVDIADAAISMVYGQSAELEGCKDREAYVDMYSKKTGALIRSAFVAGAKLSSVGVEVEDMIAMLKEYLNSGKDGLNGNKDKELKCVSEFAEHLGIAFQFADDLIDGDEKSILAVIDREEAQKLLDEHTDLAKKCAAELAYGDELVAFAEELWKRNA